MGNFLPAIAGSESVRARRVGIDEIDSVSLEGWSLESDCGVLGGSGFGLSLGVEYFSGEMST